MTYYYIQKIIKILKKLGLINEFIKVTENKIIYINLFHFHILTINYQKQFKKKFHLQSQKINSKILRNKPNQRHKRLVLIKL